MRHSMKQWKPEITSVAEISKLETTSEVNRVERQHNPATEFRGFAY